MMERERCSNGEGGSIVMGQQGYACVMETDCCGGCMQAYANLGEATATREELLLLLAEEACARPQLHKSLPAVAWSLTVAGCLPDPLLRKVPVPSSSPQSLGWLKLEYKPKP